MPNGSDIIIKGDGSVEVEFNGSIYTSEGRKHHNKEMKLIRVLITDDVGGVKYDSGEERKGLKWTIRAYATK